MKRDLNVQLNKENEIVAYTFLGWPSGSATAKKIRLNRMI